MIPPTRGEGAAKQNKKDAKIAETIFNNLMISAFISFGLNSLMIFAST